MGRKSKLTDAQWDEIDKALLSEANQSELARKYGITEAAIRKRKSSSVEKIKVAANHMLETEKMLEALPISSRNNARTYAERMKAMSDDLLQSAANGLVVSRKLSEIAARKSQNMTDFDIDNEQSAMQLKSIAALSRTANESAAIGIDLMKANKESMSDPDESNSNQPEMILLVAPEANNDHGEDRATTEANTGI